eukprot:3963136-Karenia_brevis.AAC.1
MVSPPQNTPSKIETLKQAAISTITATGSMVQKVMEFSIASDTDRSRSQSASHADEKMDEDNFHECDDAKVEDPTNEREPS